ncbi:hypothetical protein ACQP00_27680 [Dactylosporangium sp. CS-047395]|uniref:hypothetical protein n=1 Tax=Dactylosporangium sp. CS-047395 TaxID=3239936 RepID=UPI003D8DACD9
MHHVRAQAVRWVEEDWPRWVEVHLVEADGTVVSIVEKVPVVDDTDRMVPGCAFPVELEIPCDVVDGSDERAVAIRLHHGIEDQQGRTLFHVDARSLTTA